METARRGFVNLPAAVVSFVLSVGAVAAAVPVAGVAPSDPPPAHEASPPAVNSSPPANETSPPANETWPLLQETDFSGYWAQDSEASRVGTPDVLAGLGGGGAPQRLFISQARNGALIISSGHNPSVARAYSIGGETRVPAPGEQGGTMTMSTRREGGALLSEGEVERDDGVWLVREVLSLARGGDTLVIEAAITGPAGKAENRLVYRRWVSR